MTLRKHFCNYELKLILDRKCKGLLESGFDYSSNDVVSDLAQEILDLRKQLRDIAVKLSK